MRIRTLTSAGAWALGDQILSSATNFAAGIVVGRTVGPAGYGSFMLAFGSWIILLGATRAILVLPYTVAASGAPASDWRRATKSTAGAVLAFGIVFGVVALIAGAVLGPDSPTGSAFLALGLFGAPLALQDFWRFAAFSQDSPRAAALNDGVWAVVQALSLGALVLTHTLTPATAVVSWGLGAAAGALFGLRQFRISPALGRSERNFIRQNAAMAGWFGLSNASYQAGSYGAILMVGAGVGPEALGGLGSVRNLLTPARLVLSSSESIVLPIAVRAAKKTSRAPLNRLCRLYSLASAGFYAVIGLAVILVGPPTLRFVFGENFVRYSELFTPVVAATTISGLASGWLIGFRALGQGRSLTVLQTISTIVQLLIIAVALPFGLLTVAWGLAAGEAVRSTLAWVMFAKSASSAAVGKAPAEEATAIIEL